MDENLAWLIQKTEESNIKKNFIAPFYGWGSTASSLVPLRGGSLLFTTKFRDIPGTHKTRKRNKKTLLFQHTK